MQNISFCQHFVIILTDLSNKKPPDATNTGRSLQLHTSEDIRRLMLETLYHLWDSLASGTFVPR